jgi:hypothetical protein
MHEVEKYKEMRKNPVVNAGVTFLEPFPIGLIVTLISAAVLRKRSQPAAPEAALPVSS